MPAGALRSRRAAAKNSSSSSLSSPRSGGPSKGHHGDPSGKRKEFFPRWALAVVFLSFLAAGLYEARKLRAARRRAPPPGEEPPVRVKAVDDAAATGGGDDRKPAAAAASASAEIRARDASQRLAAADSPDAAAALSVALPVDDPTLLADDLGTRLHVVFSTDCGTFQLWQSYLMFYSALRVRQPGRVTRIASGCSDEEAEAARAWHARNVEAMSPRFGLHLTPHFSSVTDGEGKKVGDYKFFNKPFGLRHWLEHGEGMGVDPATGRMRDEDAVVILIDPDMALLRPITSDFSDDRGTLVGRAGLERNRVAHGSPFGQAYGLGTQWMKFDLSRIAGADSPALAVTKDDGRDHYPVGPPYLATVRDMHAIATKWSEFAPRVHAEYPHLLAEMYAYCIAAAHLKLPHQKINSLMVSNSETPGEGWPLVDKIPTEEVCTFAARPDHSKYALPNVMHLCQRYIVGPWFFAKRKLPHDFFSCDSPLLEVPEPDLAVKYDYKIKPIEKERVGISKKAAKQDAFMMCGTIGYLNEAAIFFKRKGCSDGANYSNTLNLRKLFDKKK